MGQVTIMLSGDEARLLRSLDRVVQKERELARKAAEAGEKSERGSRRAQRGHRGTLRAIRDLERGQESAFGARALGQLSRYTAGVLSVGGAFQAVLSQLKKLEQERDRLGQSQRQAADPLRSLAQLSLGNSGKYRQLVQASKQTFAEGGAGSLGEAANLVFALESAGALGERKTFSQLRGIVNDPAELARAAKAIQSSVGREETGSLRQILSKALGASGKAPSLAPQLLKAAARGGGAARLLGLSDEDLLAGTATIAEGSTPEQGGTRLAALLQSLAKRGGFKSAIRGGGLPAAIQQLEGKRLSDPELFKFLGSEEAFLGFSSLRQNRGKLDEVFNAVVDAERNDAVSGAIRDASLTPEARGAMSARMQAAKLELARAGEGVSANRASAALDRYRAGRADPGSLSSSAMDTYLRFRRSFGDDVAIRDVELLETSFQDRLGRARRSGAFAPALEAYGGSVAADIELGTPAVLASLAEIPSLLRALLSSSDEVASNTAKDVAQDALVSPGEDR